ncbi:hypothetical protein IMG5_145160 [Ichthyophthirius multifiliis]|uniref:Uncharacterized protein n=1 Tax=Ichthyophthirius multifiliis TaxID=5932 RepID=G0QXT6_ICHMU|nr:hypothetical protein IMG5_145160 [Ichthyophthirius multifiliis]EGR29967.1 hypothetical protein IMG5_145160 [Ichthyophthirius multifiliis]|eukprot:XP_004031203.1 hypothetical protein IMG5_145160 [Ichthyophthirius multifiliis]
MSQNQSNNPLGQSLIDQQVKSNTSGTQFFRRSINEVPVPRFDSPFQFGRKSYQLTKAQPINIILSTETEIPPQQLPESEKTGEKTIQQAQKIIENQDFKKLLDFVEDNQDAIINTQKNPVQNSHRMSEVKKVTFLEGFGDQQDQNSLNFQTDRVSKIQQAARQTIFLSSSLNFNIDDVMGFEDNKFLIRNGGSRNIQICHKRKFNKCLRGLQKRNNRTKKLI